MHHGEISQEIAKERKVPDKLLREHGSNLDKKKRDDQILHLEAFTKAFADKGGVLDFYQEDHTPLAPKGMSKQDWTYQLSDHLPLWVQLNTDNDAEKLGCSSIAAASLMPGTV